MKHWCDLVGPGKMSSVRGPWRSHPSGGPASEVVAAHTGPWLVRKKHQTAWSLENLTNVKQERKMWTCHSLTIVQPWSAVSLVFFHFTQECTKYIQTWKRIFSWKVTNVTTPSVQIKASTSYLTHPPKMAISSSSPNLVRKVQEVQSVLSKVKHSLISVSHLAPCPHPARL